MTTKIKIKTFEATMENQLCPGEEGQLRIVFDDFAQHLNQILQLLGMTPSHSELLRDFAESLERHMPESENKQAADLGPFPHNSDLQIKSNFTENENEMDSESGGSSQTWEELDKHLYPMTVLNWRDLETPASLGQAIGGELTSALIEGRGRATSVLYQTSLAQIHLLLMRMMGIEYINPKDSRVGADYFAHEVVRNRLLNAAPSSYFVTEPIRGYRNDKKAIEKVKTRDLLDPDKEAEFYRLLPGVGLGIATRVLKAQGIELSELERIAEELGEKYRGTVMELQQDSGEIARMHEIKEEPSPANF